MSFLEDICRYMWFYHKNVLNAGLLIFAIILVDSQGTGSDYSAILSLITSVMLMCIFVSYLMQNKLAKQYKEASPEFVTVIKYIEKNKQIIWLLMNVCMFVAVLIVNF